MGAKGSGDGEGHFFRYGGHSSAVGGLSFRNL